MHQSFVNYRSYRYATFAAVAAGAALLRLRNVGLEAEADDAQVSLRTAEAAARCYRSTSRKAPGIPVARSVARLLG